MGAHALLSLAAFVVSGFTFTYVFAQHRRSPVYRAFLLLTGWFAAWMLVSFLVTTGLRVVSHTQLRSVHSVAWAPVGFLVLHFTYSLLERPRDLVYYLSFTIAAVLLSASIVLGAAATTRELPGPVIGHGPLILHPLVIAPGVLLPTIYCWFAVRDAWRKGFDPVDRGQLSLILIAIILTFVVGPGVDVTILLASGSGEYEPMGVLSIIALSICVFAVMRRHGTLSLAIERVAADRRYQEHLQRLVYERTQELICANEMLEGEIWERRSREAELRHQETILRAASQATNCLLTISDTPGAIQKAVSILGEAIGVDRICILEEMIARKDPRVKEVFDWRRRPGGSNGRSPLPTSFLWVQSSIETWSADLRRGRVVEVDAADLEGEASEIARTEGIRSVMIVPAQVGDDVWGYVCFVDYYGKKRWTDHEKWVLMTVAAGIAGAVKQRRTEEAYREGQDRLRGIVENALDLICELGEDGRYVYASASHASTMGYSTEDLLGRDFFEFVHPEEREWARREFQLSLASRSSVHLEVRYRHPSGAWRRLEINGKPYRSVTGDVLAVLVSRDITRRKQVEDELLKSNKLESLGILAGGIAHDFNNILGILWSNISLAKLLARDQAMVVEHLAEAERVLTRARDMTKQLLTFARGGEPVKKTVSLADLVRESARFSLSGTGVAIQISEADDLWPVDVDEGQINQVFNNIFINAHQAMPEGGTITVSVENAYVTPDRGTPLPAGRYVVASVRDTGIGMDSDTVARIFDPYFTTKPHGSGLGLTTAYSIVKKHNGHISASSQEGEGAVFTVYLPASTAGGSLIKAPAAELLNGSGRILVMDDEEAFRRSLVRLLREAGYEAAAACDGREAVELYSDALRQGHPYDAVIMDLTVRRGLGGKETIRRLRELDPNVRAIASSGYSDDPIMAEYESYGFAAVLAKPYTAGELAEALHACSQLDARSRPNSSDDSTRATEQ